MKLSDILKKNKDRILSELEDGVKIVWNDYDLEYYKIDTVFHPSSFYPCARYLVFSILSPRKIDTLIEIKKKLDVGNDIHRRIQNYAWKSGILYGEFLCGNCGYKWTTTSPASCKNCSVPVIKFNNQIIHYNEIKFIDKKHNVKGKIDGILNVDGKKYIWEIKSANSYSFKRFTKMPPENYLNQIEIYRMFISKKIKGIKGLKLHFENKDDQSWKILDIPENKDRQTMIKKVLITAKEYLDNKKMPKKVCKDCYSRLYKGCIYKDICFMNKTFRQYKKMLKDI